MHPLLDDLANGQEGAAAALTSALLAAGGPLVHDGVYTFVWQGQAESVGLQCGAAEGNPSTAMHRVDGTATWYLDVEAPADTYVAYRFIADDPFLAETPQEDADWLRLMLAAQGTAHADPHNRRRIAPLAALFGLDVPEDRWESVLSGAEAPSDHWFADHDAPAGPLEPVVFESRLMDQTRTVTVWAPPGEAIDRPLVLLLDGSSFLHLALLPRALERAVADGDFTAPVVAFVGEAHTGHGLLDRVVEMTCNPTYAAMLTDELVPMLRDRFPVSLAAAHTVLGGASLGGLASAHAALARPDVIGNVLSVSGSYWWGVDRDGAPEWLTRHLTPDAPPLRIYQQIGRFEDRPLPHTPGVTHLEANRRFHTAAAAAGHHVHYEELATAHDVCAFRVAVMRGLAHLLG